MKEQLKQFCLLEHVSETQKYGTTKAVTGNQLYLVLPILMFYNKGVQHAARMWPTNTGPQGHLGWTTLFYNYGYFLNRSPDMTPCDFYLLGFIKDCVYVPRLPADLSDLRYRMEAVVARISSDTLKKVWDELSYWLDL
ncbi:uncharacterized protein TNCV_267711 [Trichonephila clavipes]|nr:uncharacterized protein TNCV_267711 [Trichonephila clavipes]